MSFYGTCHGCMQRWELGTKSTCVCDEPGMKYEFKVDGQDRTPDWRKQMNADNILKCSTDLGIGTIPQPSGTIHFHSSDTVEVMRLSRAGVWANPDVPVDEAAQAVLDALDYNIKLLVERAVQDEREACARICEGINDGTPYNLTAECAAAIRSRT